MKLKMDRSLGVVVLLSLVLVFLLSACSRDEDVVPANSESNIGVDVPDSTPESPLTPSSDKKAEATGQDQQSSALKPTTGASGQQSSDGESGTGIEDSPVIQKFKAILQDEATFYSTGAGKDIKISQINQAVSSDDSVVAEVSRFTVLDLDGDGTMEMVLQLTVNGNEYYGFEALHEHDDIIYGYTLWYRGFRDLKTDGAFYFSSSAANHGWGVLRFDGKELVEIRKAEQASVYDEDDTQAMEYFVDGEKATKDDYSKAMSPFYGKSLASWYEFNNDNFEKLLP